jgi:hypothetical protein
MTLTTGGNVGVGTTTPSTKLHVAAGMVRVDSGYGMEFGGTTNFIIGDSPSNTMRFYTNNTERMRIDSSGNVGIGTSSPAVKLDIRGGGGTASTLRIGSDTNDTGTIQFFNTTGSTINATIAGNLEGGNAGGNLTFSTKLLAGSLAERMRIDSGGNVIVGGTTGLNLGSGRGNLTVNGSTDAILNFGINSVARGYLYHSGTNMELFNSAAGYLNFATSNTERMRINSTGDIGIGTSSPTARLTVVTSGTNQGVIRVSDNATFYGEFARVQATDEVRLGSYGASQNLTFYTVSSERMRITSTGAVTTPNTASAAHEFGVSRVDGIIFDLKNAAASNPYGAQIKFTGATPNDTTRFFLSCEDTTNVKLNIYSSGTVTNRTGTYNSFSDLKIKQDIIDASSQWNDIKSLRIVKYRLKDEVAADPNYPSYIGVIAQEVEQVSPGLIDNCPDFEEVEVTDEEGNVTTERRATGEVTKSVKSSIIYMKAVKALQEAMERIEILETRLNALEGK